MRPSEGPRTEPLDADTSVIVPRKAQGARPQSRPCLLDDLARRAREGRPSLDFAWPVFVSRVADASHMESAVVHPLGEGADAVLAVGRAPELEVHIDDATVSRHHATLERHGGAWFLKDEGSTNGTFVGDVKIAPGASVELAIGLKVRLGPKLVCGMLDERGLASLVSERAAALERRRRLSAPIGRQKLDEQLRIQDTLRRSYPEQLANDLLAASISHRVSAAPFAARRWFVALEGAIVEEFESASELKLFLFENVRRVVQVEGKAEEGGASRIVWRRAGIDALSETDAT